MAARALTAAITSVAVAVLVVLAYAGAQSATAGYFGLMRSSGWALYSRTAQFADCTRFTPPEGTRRLCERTPPEQRPGPDFYGWQPGSPARRAFGGAPEGGPELSAFARAAILNQPLDYVRTVANDTMRYFAPTWNAERPFGGVGYELMDLDRRAEGTEQAVDRELDGYYDPDRLRIRAGVQALTDLQQVLRVHPILLLQFVLVALAGLIGGRGRGRAAIVLLLGTAGALLVIPPATAIYSARYAVPVDGLLAAAGALGAWALLGRRQGTAAEEPPPPVGATAASAKEPVTATTAGGRTA